MDLELLAGLVDGLMGVISEHGEDHARRYWSDKVIKQAKYAWQYGLRTSSLLGSTSEEDVLPGGTGGRTGGAAQESAEDMGRSDP